MRCRTAPLQAGVHRLGWLRPWICTLQKHSCPVPATRLSCADLFSVQGVYPGAQGGSSGWLPRHVSCASAAPKPSRPASVMSQFTQLLCAVLPAGFKPENMPAVPGLEASRTEHFHVLK